MNKFKQEDYARLRLEQVDIEQVIPNPHQPRQVFNEEALKELADSISANGVLQPITVKETEGGYELIAGERRLRASKLAGYTKIPAVIAEADAEQSSVLALLENVQREDLNFFEEAKAYRKLSYDFGFRQEQIAELTGKSQPAIANKLRLLKLSEPIQKKITDAGLSERHARALLKIENEENREAALNKAIKNGYTVNQLEAYAAKQQEASVPKKGRTKLVIKDVRPFINSVNQAADIMRQAGLDVQITEEKEMDYYQMNIRVNYPKDKKEK